MFKHRFLVFALTAAVSASLAYAQQDTKTEKDKPAAKEQKDKDKDKEKEKRSGEYQLEPAGSLLSLSLGDAGYLGVYLEEVTPERVKELGLREERGALVMKVIEGSPAEKSGFKQNDVIISFNGRRVDTVREMQRLLNETPAGRTVTVEIVRSGATQALTATLNKRSGGNLFQRDQKRLEQELKRSADAMGRSLEAQRRAEETLRSRMKGLADFNSVGPGRFSVFRGGRLGITIETLTPQLGEYFGVKDGHGALVTEVQDNSAGAKGGLKAGDVITGVDGKKVDDVQSAQSAIAAKGEGQLTLTILRNRKEQTITVTIEKPLTVRPTRRVARTRSV